VLKLRRLLWGGPGVKPHGLPFWCIVITPINLVSEPLHLVVVTRYGGPPPDLAGSHHYIIFEFLDTGCP
jgi:hypothetical protein